MERDERPMVSSHMLREEGIDLSPVVFTGRDYRIRFSGPDAKG
jgi:hypothetical protein